MRSLLCFLLLFYGQAFAAVDGFPGNDAKKPNPKIEENLNPSSLARKKRIYWIDFGVGFPQLTSVELALQMLKNVQLGFSYGMLPGGSGGSISPKYTLESQNVTLTTGAHITIKDPSISVSFSSLCPFIRYFPNETGFYLQFTMGILKVNNTLSAELYDVSGNKVAGAEVSGLISVTQLLPTLAMGHIFNSKFFFYSVNMGISAISSLSMNTSFTSYIPESLGGNAANQAAIDDINSKNSEAAAKASDQFKEMVSFLPSLQFVFGFFF